MDTGQDDTEGREFTFDASSEEWQVIDLLQQDVPKAGTNKVCELVVEYVLAYRHLIGHVSFDIWHCQPGRYRLEWIAGHDAVLRPAAPFGPFRIEDSELRDILVERKLPVLEAEYLAGVEKMPTEIWSRPGNWIFPLTCRKEFFGLLHFGFDAPPKKPVPPQRFWFCDALARYLARAIERSDSSHDNHLISERLLPALSNLLKESGMKNVYEQIIEDICEIAGSEGGVFRLYDPHQNFFIVCGKLHLADLPQEALAHHAGVGPCDCPSPDPNGNPSFCPACESCRQFMPLGAKPLRTTFWDAQTPDNKQTSNNCIGQVCSFLKDESNDLEAFNKDLDSNGRLTRRLKSVARSLSAVMETALHQFVRRKVEEILEGQRALASTEINTRKLLKGLMERINTVMHAQETELLIADPHGTRLTLEASSCEPLEKYAYDRSYNITDENHLTSLVAHEQHPLAIPNIKKWHDNKTALPIIRPQVPYGPHAFLGVPLFREGNKVAGVIRCSNKSGYPADRNGSVPFHRHDIAILEAIAESCSPLILAITSERRMTERLAASGHEVTAAAALIQWKADQLLDQAPSQWYLHGVKGIRDAAKLISIFQDDVSASLSNDAISWDSRPSNIHDHVIAQVVDMLRAKALAASFQKDTSKASKPSHDEIQQIKQIEIMYDPRETAPEIMHLDPLRMKQLFYNLITNAIKYTRMNAGPLDFDLPDFGRIHLDPRQVLVRFRYLANRTAFQVDIISNGYQIHKDEVEHIWEYGFRGNAVKKRKAGLGLGMYVCKKIEKAAKGLELQLTSLYEPVIFTVKFVSPIFKP